MIAVMASIHPEHCNKIEAGYKTNEVRRTKPYLDCPFKVYIYCTKGGEKYIAPTDFSWVNTQIEPPPVPAPVIGNGMVVGEFICDYIHSTFDPACGLVDAVDCEQSCLTSKEIIRYADGDILHFWHISNSVFYTKPKRIEDFRRAALSRFVCKKQECDGCCECTMTRPPQSWCYVEEIHY